MLSYAERRQTLIDQLRASRGGELALGKATSNLFRDRTPATKQRLDVRAFHHVLEVDAKQGWVDVEGMTPYDVLAAATLRHGVMPCVVPQLKSITIGGAVAGVAIEATSFRYGLAHATMLELEVLLADGSVVVCTADNEHRDLFFGFPNSYGTLGYALRVRTKTIPTKPYVAVTHIRHTDARAYFEQMGELCKAADVDFLDGTVFAKDALFISVGRFVDTAPYVSDYTFEEIYYRSIRNREHDFLTAADYLMALGHRLVLVLEESGRAKSLAAPPARPQSAQLALLHQGHAAQQPLAVDAHARSGFRPPASRNRHSRRRRAIDARRGFSRLLSARGRHHADLDLSDRHARTVDAVSDGSEQDVRELRFLGRRAQGQPHAPGHFNRLVERKVSSSAASNRCTRNATIRAKILGNYGGEAYRALKARYDPDGNFPDLYSKCVLRH